MYFTDRGIEELAERRGGEQVALGWLAERMRDFVDEHPDAESTVDTVADGMAAHPTLSEAVKEAGLVALGRAIHLPNRKPREAAS